MQVKELLILPLSLPPPLRSLLVEVTLPSMDPGGVHPSSMEDVFESAVHSVHDATAMRRLWMEYLSYLRAQVAVAGGATYQNFKVLIVVED